MESIARFAQLIQRSRNYGLRSAVVLVGKNLPRPLYAWLPRHRIRQHRRFDSKYSVDTQMPVRVSELETTAPGARFANRYEGTPIAPLHKIIRRLKVDRLRFTFIDLGSGKGRVLLIAGQYPFKAVIGIEFSKILHDVALSNIVKFNATGLLKTDVTSVHCDAGEFDFSGTGDKIVFCYNPFSAELMVRVLANLQSAARHAGETIFLYLGPMPAAVSEKLADIPIIGRGEFISEFGYFEQYFAYKLR